MNRFANHIASQRAAFCSVGIQRCGASTHQRRRRMNPSHPHQVHSINYYQSNTFSSTPTNNTLRAPTASDVSYFQSTLSRPERSVLTTLTPTSTNEDELSKYNQDWTNHYQGHSQLALRPQTTAEVSSILSYCNKNLIGVVPQGGNTGLCGGATPISNEIILSLQDMNQINCLDEHSGILQCDSGCILQNLHEYAYDKGFLFPLDIGSKGTCQIGGNVSTNAGGQYFYRFGGLHGTVVGLEVVLPNGRILQLNIDDVDVAVSSDKGVRRRSSSHRKDNTGYDLKHLFIGAEGTLGIITKVAIACPTLPASKNVALLVCNSYQDVLSVLQSAKEELAEILSAMELMDLKTLMLVREFITDVNSGEAQLLKQMMTTGSNSTQQSKPLYLLVETQGSNSQHDSSKMDSFLTRLYESEAIHNGFLAQDSKQMMSMWSIRESCNPSVAKAGYVHKFDVSIPIDEYIDVAEEVKVRLDDCTITTTTTSSSKPAVCVWGHVADGNAHINIVTPGEYQKNDALAEYIEQTVYESVLKRKGSISAEHGLGQSKNEYLGRIKEKNAMEAMLNVKEVFDPNGIMNPGKFLPN
jgi:FAD/FMN-containing dehydrogenase